MFLYTMGSYSKISIHKTRNEERQIRGCPALSLAATPLDAKAWKGGRG